MPEAPIDEDRYLGTRERKIGSTLGAGQRPVDPEPMTQSVNV
jgi:hypothetical protein